MKVLVTGAGGQLGAALVRCAPAGFDVIAADRATLDIGDRAQVAEFVERARPALILNAAAYTAVDKAEGERALAFRINSEGPAHLAEAAARHQARLLHVSTDYVFDGTKATPYLPDDATNPVSVYGESKLAGERAALERCENALVVRTAWLYAAVGKNFVNTMLRLMRERPEVRVVSDQRGTPTHAASLAKALWAMAASDARGIVHWTDAGECSWHEFAIAIRDEATATGFPLTPGLKVTPILTSEYPTPAKRPANSRLDKTASWKLTGPARPWQDELRDCLARRPA